MRTLEELIEHKEPAWPLVKEWIAGATNRVDVLPVDPARASVVLHAAQVTTRSPMGAIVYHTGGLVIDGWLRVLGGSGPRMRGDLARWNGIGTDVLFDGIGGGLVVALDVLGGVYLIVDETRAISYFAPDSLTWEELGMGYSEFVHQMMRAKLDDFYGGMRWEGWREEVAAMSLSLDDGIHVMPPLWSAESRTLPNSRKPVPMSELVGLGFEMQRQLSE